MIGLKSEVKGLGDTVASGFATLGAKFERMSATNAARPAFNIHQMVQTVLAGAILFSMIVAGIIYVSQSQFSGLIADQKSTNERVKEKIDELASRVGWLPVTKREP